MKTDGLARPVLVDTGFFIALWTTSLAQLQSGPLPPRVGGASREGCAIILDMPTDAAEPILERLDATGLNCPMPLLKAKKALNELAPGDRLEVIATDPGSVRDFKVFSEQSGHALLKSRQENDRYYYLLQKASA